MAQPFTFGALPPELRALIWEHALAQPMLINASAGPATPRCPRAVGGQAFDNVTFRPAGPTTWAVGQVCREARGLFERTHERLTLPEAGGGPAAGAQCIWINADTVVFLGPARQALIPIMRIDEADRSKVVHVAASLDVAEDPDSFSEVAPCYEWLATECPSIRTFIVWPSVASHALDIERRDGLCDARIISSVYPYVPACTPGDEGEAGSQGGHDERSKCSIKVDNMYHPAYVHFIVLPASPDYGAEGGEEFSCMAIRRRVRDMFSDPLC